MDKSFLGFVFFMVVIWNIIPIKNILKLFKNSIDFILLSCYHYYILNIEGVVNNEYGVFNNFKGTC